ncbi:chemotaxis protein CheW [Polynucleobacter sp. UK-Gri1-W3]|nr:chemotaxis protein CheW [Polynucleobacter sp. UK-Gri1-W3]MBU3538683.1 chemotaxis protein CheW [Polynucleobacter sp. UK-Gri1-W3]
MPSFLVFESESVRYAIPTESVDSIFWMPELSPIEAAPPWFIGLANWHGEVVHILDLSLRFKHSPRSYSTLTNIILVSAPQMRCGIVSDSVMGLVDVPLESIVKREMVMPSDFSTPYADLIEGEIKHEDQIVLLLNLQKLLTVQIGDDASTSHGESELPSTKFLAEHNEEIFRARMHQLAMPIIDQQEKDRDGFAIVAIGEIRYAIEIAYIAEFAHLKQCAPLPCCPPYILGVINLRGEILSVIDMTTLLNIQNIADKRDIVILQFESKRIALAVQRVEDFRYFDRHHISALQDVEDQHAQCKSLLKVDDGVAGILDIEAILLSSMLEIEERI